MGSFLCILRIFSTCVRMFVWALRLPDAIAISEGGNTGDTMVIVVAFFSLSRTKIMVCLVRTGASHIPAALPLSLFLVGSKTRD